MDYAHQTYVQICKDVYKRQVWGMVPKGRLGRQIIKKLFVYAGPEHKHSAQQPVELPLRYIGGSK